MAPEGNFLDQIYGADVNALENDCLSDLVHASDHHPIASGVFPQSPALDTLLRYRQLWTEKFSEYEIRRMEQLIKIFHLPNSSGHALSYVHVGLG